MLLANCNQTYDTDVTVGYDVARERPSSVKGLTDAAL